MIIKFLVDFYLNYLGPQRCINESHLLRRTVAGDEQHMPLGCGADSGKSQHEEPTQLRQMSSKASDDRPLRSGRCFLTMDKKPVPNLSSEFVPRSQMVLCYVGPKWEQSCQDPGSLLWHGQSTDQSCLS